MGGARNQQVIAAMTRSNTVLFVQARKDRDKPLFRQIADQIRSHVACGVLTVGERLPGFRKLAKMLSVSEDTVTKAYATLLDEGIIEARPRSGYFVAKKLELTGATPHPGVYQKFPAGMPARRSDLENMFREVPESIGRLQRVESGALAPFVLAPEHAGAESKLAGELSGQPLLVLPLNRFSQGAEPVAGLVFNALAGTDSEFLETAGALVRALRNCGGSDSLKLPGEWSPANFRFPPVQVEP